MGQQLKPVHGRVSAIYPSEPFAFNGEIDVDPLRTFAPEFCTG